MFMRRNHSKPTIGLLLLAVVVIAAPWSLAAKEQKPEKRAKAPRSWDKRTVEAFDANAFARLKGARPKISAGKSDGGGGPDVIALPESGEGKFAWSKQGHYGEGISA